MPANSPWIHQLNRTRPVHSLNQNSQTDVAIVGAGIAGICTAYFTLKHTNQRVTLIEGHKVAHGATGHNAGQIVSYFERQVSDLVKEFGLELTAQAQSAVDSAWTLLDEIYKDTGITTPFSKFVGYAGCQDLNEILMHLENSWYCYQVNLPIEPLYIAEEANLHPQIPLKYQGLYALVPHTQILEHLETKNPAYIAILTAKKGCMNSALFCEDLLAYMLATFSDRFELFEHSPMIEVILQDRQAILKILEYELTAKKVVLCTNGFERFTIRNTVGADVDRNFHHLVRGTVGYMAAYLEPRTKPPTAISYLPVRQSADNNEFDEHPYIYLTRREFELNGDHSQSLVCIGGPEAKMDDSNNYQPEHPYPEEAQAMIDSFLHESFASAPSGEIQYHYKWHGLMGYTPNGVRCIGPEPANPVLLYNLGCNGIGILPSLYGGRKISQFLAGETLPPSIFDPKTFDLSQEEYSPLRSEIRSLLQGAQ